MPAQVTLLCLGPADVGTAARANILCAHIMCAYAGRSDSSDSPEGAAQILRRAQQGVSAVGRRHDQLVQADKGLPKQELPATMLSMDYTRVWYTDE